MIDIAEREIIKINQELNIDNIPLNDIDTLRFLAKGECFQGVFQLLMFTTRQLCKDLIPPLIEKFERDGQIGYVEVVLRVSDIATIIRPACINIGATERYKKRALGEEVDSPIKGNYFLQMFEKHTTSTFNELLYQEQTMTLLNDLFQLDNLGIADDYRRIFEKNDEKKLNELKQKFWDLYKNDVSLEDCKQFWEFFVLCAGYGFNKSHAAKYAILAIITAYLKCKMPKFYIATCINDCKNDAKMKDYQKIEAFVHDAEKMGIKIFPPRINNCYAITTPDRETETIYLSAHVLKGLGEAISNHLSKSPQFKTIEEFIEWSRKIYSYSVNEAGKEHKTKIFNKGVYEILTRMRFFEPIEKDVHKVAKIFNEYYITSEPQWRTKTMFKTLNGKKFNGYAYKLVKGEELYKDFDLTCKVIVKEKLLDNDITIEKSSFKYEMEYCRFVLTDYVSAYNQNIAFSELSNMGYVLIEDVKHGTKKYNNGKPDYIYTNFKVRSGEVHRDVIPETIHLSKVHKKAELGDIAFITYEDGVKFYVRSLDIIDRL